MKEFNFSLEAVEIPVNISGKAYVLREASEAVAEEFQNWRTRGVKLVNGRFAGLPDDLAGIQSMLVSRCLFSVGEDGAEVPVPEATVKQWPSRIVKPLFEEAKRVSDLDETLTLPQLRERREEIEEQIRQLEEEGDQVGNAPSGTPAGST